MRNKPLIKEPVIDLQELVVKVVDQRVSKVEELVIKENEQTRTAVVELKDLVIELQGSKVHNVIQYALIAFIILGMILIKGC